MKALFISLIGSCAIMNLSAQYCTPVIDDYGANTPGITFFSCGTFSHSSPTLEHYINTGLSMNLQKGSSYLINMSFTHDLDSCASMNARAWIDYNQNDVLDDALETLIQFNNQTQTAVQGGFTVPQTALIGTTRLRIAVKMSEDCGYLPMEPCNNPPDPIGWFGEIEDYDVNINAVGIDEVTSAVSNITLFPNPSDQVLNGSFFMDHPVPVSLMVTDLTGRIQQVIVSNQHVGEGEFDFSFSPDAINLPDGIFLLQISSPEGTIAKPFIVSRQ